MQNSYKELKDTLIREKIETWFDINLFLDRIKDNPGPIQVPPSFEKFKKEIRKGIAFITFNYGVDGVSIEISKYARAFERIYEYDFKDLLGSEQTPNIYLIGGAFHKESETIMSCHWKKIPIEKLGGFGFWDGYNEYFHTELVRGGREYNILAKKVWSGAVDICLELGKIIHDNNIRLLIPVNVSSNPGNVGLACALTIISEYMDVFVVGNHHDFYWEEGKRKKDRKKGEPPGIRDHFFKNAHLGEVFSLIETLYPYNGKRWFHTVINKRQIDRLVSKFGFNPNSINRIPTTVDLKKYRPSAPDEKAKILNKLQLVFSNGTDNLFTRGVGELDEDCRDLGFKGDPLFLGYENNIPVNLKIANLLFLQPTRIIKRKRIELNYCFIESLLKQTDFWKFLREHSQLTITLLITGPIADGHGDYFNFIINQFKEFLNRIPPRFRKRIFLACPFGLENKSVLLEAGLKDITIEEVFSVASLTLLPSKTEGRGLPIVESCASGVPILCNRYSPLHVYKEVVGEDLEVSKRLEIFDFHGNEFPVELLNNIANVFINPESFRKTRIHNRDVVKKRYSNLTLYKSINKSLYSLWQRCREDKEIIGNIKEAFALHYKRTHYGKEFSSLVLTKNRSYIPGYTHIEFMMYLKSLIDPSFFRMEEMELRGRIMSFVRGLISWFLRDEKLYKNEISYFYKHIDAVFEYYEGNDSLVIDHSLSYRHRHRRHYPFRKITEQELCGILGIVFRKLIKVSPYKHLEAHSMWYFVDIKSSLLHLIGSTKDKIVIDDSDRLIRDLNSNKEFACFAGRHYQSEIKTFALSVLKNRLGLSVDQELGMEDLKKDKIKDIGRVTFLVRKDPINNIYYDEFIRWIEQKASNEIRNLYKAGLVRVVKTDILSVGIHLGQLGNEAYRVLNDIKEKGGFVIAFETNSFMLDMIDMPSYRLGKIEDLISANFMGLKEGDAFIQWVPAGLKPSLAYPTPVQTPFEFSKILKGPLYNEYAQKFEEEKVLEALKKDADKYGNPIEVVLKRLIKAGEKEGPIISTQINGIYKDGLPWSGAYAKLPLSGGKWKFIAIFARRRGETVLSLADKYEGDSGEKISLAWNGGYILNPELVGKLGLSEDYIGSPLGYVCVKDKIFSLPLYNKAAFLIEGDSKIKIKRLNLKNGFTAILPDGKPMEFKGTQRNKVSSNEPIYYDLLFPDKTIPGKDRTIYRLVGNRVIEKIINTENVKVIPVGVVLSFPSRMGDINLEEGDELKFEIPGLSNVINAIEAGPMLVSSGEVAIDMKEEGFKSHNSISTQAARIDYTNMRGPKIGGGLTREGDLILIAINGRIRESVGATHVDLANILIEHGATDAMGFDPGGSVTLIVDGKQLNISPYNKDYEDNVHSLPPTPRFVGNAILGCETFF